MVVLGDKRVHTKMVDGKISFSQQFLEASRFNKKFQLKKKMNFHIFDHGTIQSKGGM